MVQRRSARVIKHQYSREPGSATNILTDLKLTTLEIRRKIKRLCLFHKAFHHQVAINIPDYIKQQNRTNRQYYPRKFRNVQTSSNTYKYSQFPSWLLWTGIIYDKRSGYDKGRFWPNLRNCLYRYNIKHNHWKVRTIFFGMISLCPLLLSNVNGGGSN